ncbi:MAG: tRNA pseudouridine(55) synthase TruB [Clostridia bacterium]|nr:tRNA pseudouridine(55) synthase TruB [Clostridia bacterium]
MNGYFNINKPTGMSSAAVVAVLRRLTGVKRIGHAGTLDPEAAGVLPVMTGKATRLFDYLADKEKEYVAVCSFGAATDTQDATGNVTERGENYPDRDTFLRAAAQLTGEITQTPSIYSAIKVGGKPLYLRARRGETVEVPQRVVRIDSIELIRETGDHGFEIRVKCGRGTYIRTLCDDLGKLCGCPAHMQSLVRTRSGAFRIEDTVSPEEARELAGTGKLAGKLLPADYALGHLPRTDMPVKYRKMVINGAKMPLTDDTAALNEGDPVRIYLEGSFWGIAARREDELVWKAQIAPEEGPEEMN